jgi:hypothetical protein
MQDFEKLGAFYLGRPQDPKSGKLGESPLLYDSRDLVTHAVCVGMTGSGKTGLCLSLLEEAAIDGIPAIAIDPKGDLPNLLLTFPALRGEDFAPWIDEEEARRKGLEPARFAQAQADLWKKGLAEWGQDGARIQRLRDSADFAVYTPGSSAGLPISVLESFTAPKGAVLDDAEALNDGVRTTVSGLLGLVGIDADPMGSREHILLSTIVTRLWRSGRDIDLAGLIGLIQDPQIEKVGVLDLESFYPRSDRFGLAMRINNLLASPGFGSWIEGEPLDIGAMLYTPSGKPRISIFSIAHLGDAERMFFVSLLLNQILGWVRAQPGTTSLRALVYMDEIFGYFPPVANPPSKGPLLTLLKQARAFGVGIVLATQNPVDLDYKGLANAGTWFIGRMQTERDKARVLDGLEGAAAASSSRGRGEMEKMISGLGNRVFLLNNVHEDGPVVFQTRWALSYLRGPLTRTQIKALMDARKSAEASAAPPIAEPSSPRPAGAAPASAQEPSAAPPGCSKTVPVLPPKVPQCFVPLRSLRPGGGELLYRPAVFGSANVYFNDARSGVSGEAERCLLVPIVAGPVPVDWNRAEELSLSDNDIEQSPSEGASFAALPPAAAQPSSYEAWKTAFADAAFRTSKLDLLRSPSTQAVSRPGESERDFRARIGQKAREERDAQVEKLRQKYAPRLAAFEDRIRRAEAAKDVQAKQASAARLQTVISFGASILGAFLGRKAISASTLGRATTAARGVGRSIKESQDVGRADENVQAIRGQMAELESQFQEDVKALETRFDSSAETLETISMRPKKTDIRVRLVSLAWVPHWRGPSGETPAYR